VVHLQSHKLAFQAEEKAALERIETTFEQAGLLVPGVGEVLQKSGVDLPKARILLQILLKDRRLVRIADDLVYHQHTLNNLRALLRSHHGQPFSVGDFKEWTGVSRKYAIPLLEFLDREKLTRRQGDVRISVEQTTR
jgi:selenocysteine-specific elongation factor